VLFTGHAELNIDAKQRLAIPAKYRAQLSPERDGLAWFCVPWSNGLLRIYTETTFTELSSKGDQTLATTEDQAEFEATLYGFAERIELDSAGRITIPKLHLQMTGLGTEVVIVGARNRLEVRDRNAWTATIPERFARLPSLVSKVEGQRQNAPGNQQR